MKLPSLTLAITGASGSIYARLLMDALQTHRNQFENIYILQSSTAETVWNQEQAEFSLQQYPFKYYQNSDFFSPVASGSSAADAMVICPCSMGTVSAIAHGSSQNLIQRAADVHLKEKRKLVLVRPDGHSAWRGDAAPAGCGRMGNLLARSRHRPALQVRDCRAGRRGAAAQGRSLRLPVGTAPVDRVDR